MASLTQGEILLILVKRDGRPAEAIADAMGVDKSYLPKLYKLEKLPPKPLRKAMAVFQVAENYFLETGEAPSSVAEPGRAYKNAGTEMERLQAENENLRNEIARLTRMLDQEKALSADLAEALKNLSKR